MIKLDYNGFESVVEEIKRKGNEISGYSHEPALTTSLPGLEAISHFASSYYALSVMMKTIGALAQKDSTEFKSIAHVFVKVDKNLGGGGGRKF